MKIDHVAILVRSLDRAMSVVRAHGLEPLAPESFPGEGTRESYVGDPKRSGRLLLVEAIGPGPYERALKKRGPGLHHLALEMDTEALLKAGWSAHPAASGWYYKKGAPFLIEAGKSEHGPSVIQKLSIPGATRPELNGNVLDWNASEMILVIEGKELRITELLR